MIARDEADRIGHCLDSVPQDAERIVVVDAATRDETAAVARAHGARVVVEPWRGFSEQRNLGAALAMGRWLLFLDADERLSAEARSSLMGALERDDIAAMSWPCCTHWLGHPIRHGRWYPDRKVRAVRRGMGAWTGAIHEQLVVRGRVAELEGDIDHRPYRDLAEHLHTIDTYSALHARLLVDEGVRARWWDLALRPPLHFVNGYLLKRGFRDGWPGLAVAGLGSAHVAAKWLRVRRGARR